MSKCECKVVKKFAIETHKSRHRLCPTYIAINRENRQLVRNEPVEFEK